MSTQKNGYFKALMAKNFLCFPLAIAALLVTLLVSAYERGLPYILSYIPTLTIYCVAILGLFGISAIIYGLLNCKKSKITFFDHLSVAFIFTAIGFAVFCFVRLGGISLTRIIISAGFFVAGVVLTLINALNFGKQKKQKILKTKGFLGYVTSLFVDHNFFLTLAIGFLIFCIVLCYQIVSNIFSINFILSFVIVCLVAVVPYFIYSVAHEKPQMIDSVLLAFVYATVANLISAILLEIEGLLSTVLVSAIIILVILFIRSACFDKDIPDKIKPLNRKNPFTVYYGKLTAKYPLVSPLALAGFIFYMLSSFGIVTHNASSTLMLPIILSYPMTVASFAAFALIIVCFCGLRQDKVTVCDFATVTLFFLGLIALISGFISTDDFTKTVLIVFGFVVLILSLTLNYLRLRRLSRDEI